MRIDINGPSDLNRIPTGVFRTPKDDEPPSIGWESDLEPGQPTKPGAGLRSIPASELLHRPVTRPAAMVERILYPGLTVFHGRPKSGKSWLALQLAIALAQGEPFAGILPTGQARRVCYLALEEPEWRTAYRLQQLLPNADSSLENVSFVYECEPLLAGGAAQLAQHLTDHPADVLIIDTFLAVMKMSGRKGSNVVAGDYNAWHTLLELAHRFGVAVLVIDHSRKGGGDITESMVSTTGSAAAVDCLWQLKRTPEAKGELEVLGRETEGEVFELAFSSEPGCFGWAIVAEGSEVGLSAERSEIVELLKAEGALKPGRIALLLKKNAVTVRRLLMKLSYEDTVRRNTDGTYYAMGGKK